MARIAYDILMEQEPEALQKANELLLKYSDRFTQQKEDKYPFVECTTWADDTRRAGGGWQSTWHYISKPLIGDNSTDTDLEIKLYEKNISMAMPILYQFLAGQNVSDTPMYQSIMKRQEDGDEEQGKSLALRLLIHYMGDVHQPLHNVQRYTKERPKGDSGANAFVLKYRYRAKNLHSVWDKVLYVYHQSVSRPFTEDAFEEFEQRCVDLRESFNFTDEEVQTLDFNRYINESYAIAEIAYDGITEGSEERVPDSYLEKFTPIARRRLALSGHRLAYMIRQLYGQPEEIIGDDTDDYIDSDSSEDQGLPTGGKFFKSVSILSCLALMVSFITI